MKLEDMFETKLVRHDGRVGKVLTWENGWTPGGRLPHASLTARVLFHGSFRAEDVLIQELEEVLA